MIIPLVIRERQRQIICKHDSFLSTVHVHVYLFSTLYGIMVFYGQNCGRKPFFNESETQNKTNLF